MKTGLNLLLLFLSISLYGQSSVLSEGTWYKIGITETGIYKIDRSTLNALGITNSFDPREMGLYGNGMKGILPQQNSADRPEDLLENAVFVSGESDGIFDQNDYLLFYGIGPHKEVWSESGFTFERNIYSDTSYYFLKIGGQEGKRIQPKSSETGAATAVIHSFNDHLTFEEDKNNLISSGRVWLGEGLSDGESLSFSHFIEGLDSDITATFDVVSQSLEEGNFDIQINSNSIGTLTTEAVPGGSGSTYSIKAKSASGSFTSMSPEEIDLRINYDGNSNSARGFVDRYHLTFKRALGLYGNETDFRATGHTGQLVQYEISNASSATIWNVTKPDDVQSQEYSITNNSAVFKSESLATEEFVVFSGSDFPTPFAFGKVENQNLHADTHYDGLIITPAAFLAEAHRLADFHRTHDQLQVKVVTLRQVFNEFSAGRQDVTALRDYAKFVYEEGGNLRYLTLFGDCSYDYKDRLSRNTNFIPTYESYNSFHPILSYSSDDYFGFFEEDEGEWFEGVPSGGSATVFLVPFDDHTMEIGVGRLPVKSLEEAKHVVDKIIYYSTSPNTLGKWRNEITYLADDGDFNIHAVHVEDLSELVDTTYAQYNISKLLLDAFDQEAGASKDLSPQASRALKTRIKEGTFSINFIGHGNERLWTEEEVLTRNDIGNFTNLDKLPIFVTATCEFGRYDNPIVVSGAEELLLSASGGGIALLTTSRPVFASTNFGLNQAFHENIFRKVNGAYQRLGDIIKATKNEGLAGPVNRNFTLLGDPMMQPAYPELEITINELNTDLDTLSALETVAFSGQVQANGTLQSDFNGSLVVGVYDVKQNFKTQGQESNPFTYSLRSNALFRGEAEVVDGEFNFSFVVPKNISYQYQRGKLSLYAWDTESNIDAAGSSREFVIGGTASNVAADVNPPQIQLFLNNENFRQGDVVGRSSLLIAKLSDESGITSARSGVVEGITLQLDGETFNLNEFYTAEMNSFQEGSVVFPLQDLEPGRHTAVLKVWDAHNNSSTSSIEFVVSEKPGIFISNERVYPNPVVDQTTFYFEHDREEEDISVSILVYSAGGNIVYDQSILFENSDRIIEIPWQPVSNSGKLLERGIYFYRMIITSKFDGAVKEIAQKLVVLN